MGDPLEVAERAGGGIHRDHAKTDLVAHDDDRRRVGGDRGETCGDRTVEDRVDIL